MKVQNNPFLKAKWQNRGGTKQPLLWIALLCVFYFWMPQENVAQPTWHSLEIKRLVKPLKPLPDSIKSYQLVVKTEVDLPYNGIDTNLFKFCSFASYAKKTSDADMILYVTIGKTIIKGQIKRTITSKDTTFRYEEHIKPQITVELVSKSGESFFHKKGGLEWVYSTDEKKTDNEAIITYDNREKVRDPGTYGKLSNSYTQKRENIHTETIVTWVREIKDFYDYLPDKVDVFYDSNYVNVNEASLFFKNATALKESFQLLNTDESQTAIIEKLEPHIHFFKHELNIDTLSVKGKDRYFASVWNLINIYRCLEDFDSAFFYIRLLLKNTDNPYNMQVAHIVSINERFEEYQHYKATKMSLQQTRQIVDSERFEALKKISSAKGYIVVGNMNTKIEGKILDIYDNFQNNKVVMAYRKNPTGDVEGTEYPLIEVKEIHIKDWHLGILPYEKRHYDNMLLTEILLKTSKIAYHRAFSEMGNPIQKPREELFLQKSGQKGFMSMDEAAYYEGFNVSIAKYMKDCPTISQRAIVGYYTKRQTLQMVMDYDSICNSESVFLLPNTDSIYKPFKGYRFYAGWNTGFKNFTSIFGLTTNLSFNGKLYLRMGIGVGYWGVRYSTGLQYNVRRDMRFSEGWSFTVGYSHNTGIKSGVTLDTKVDSMELPNKTILKMSKDYRIRPLPVNTVHFSMIHNRFYGAKTATYFELGYAIALQKTQWMVLTPNFGEPSEVAKTKINLKKPSGLIIAFGCNFRFNELRKSRKTL